MWLGSSEDINTPSSVELTAAHLQSGSLLIVSYSPTVNVSSQPKPCSVPVGGSASILSSRSSRYSRASALFHSSAGSDFSQGGVWHCCCCTSIRCLHFSFWMHWSQPYTNTELSCWYNAREHPAYSHYCSDTDIIVDCQELILPKQYVMVQLAYRLAVICLICIFVGSLSARLLHSWSRSRRDHAVLGLEERRALARILAPTSIACYLA